MRPLLTPTLLLCALAALASCAPKKNTPLADIPKLASLEDVMDNQATAADPLFRKIGQAHYDAAEIAAFVDAGTRLEATSQRTTAFSKGPEFDALAIKLGERAKALRMAAEAKNEAEISASLGEMKAICKSCHSQFR